MAVRKPNTPSKKKISSRNVFIVVGLILAFVGFIGLILGLNYANHKQLEKEAAIQTEKSVIKLADQKIDEFVNATGATITKVQKRNLCYVGIRHKFEKIIFCGVELYATYQLSQGNDEKQTQTKLYQDAYQVFGGDWGMTDEKLIAHQDASGRIETRARLKYYEADGLQYPCNMSINTRLVGRIDEDHVLVITCGIKTTETYYQMRETYN